MYIYAKDLFSCVSLEPKLLRSTDMYETNC